MVTMLGRSVTNCRREDSKRMDAQAEVRLCRCGTRLARDNRGGECHACQQTARDHRHRPPRVLPGFWTSPEMRTALATRDMGLVMHTFRTHPAHGRDIPQEVAAGWVGLTQSGL